MKPGSPRRGPHGDRVKVSPKPSTAYRRVVAALEARGSRNAGKGWQCPAHDDKDPSLVVSEGNGAALVHCHAGCSVEDVTAALGLRMADLFDEPLTPERVWESLTPRQQSRYTMPRMRGIVALPAEAFRLWAAASAMGKTIRQDGSFATLRGSDEALAVEVRPIHRDRALGLLGKDPRVWRRAVRTMESAGMAHRCEGLPRGAVRLLYEPERACPVCEAPLDTKRPQFRPMFRPLGNEETTSSPSTNGESQADTTVRLSGHHSPHGRTPQSASDADPHTSGGQQVPLVAAAAGAVNEADNRTWEQRLLDRQGFGPKEAS